MCKRALILLLLISTFSSSWGQSGQVRINELSVNGLKKTKLSTVTRELSIAQGDTVSGEELMAILEDNRLSLINTGLFSDVNFNISNWLDEQVDVSYHLIEAWYIYPAPTIDFIDPNFNTWLKDQNGNFNRLTFGALVVLDNLTGRADPLEVSAQFGFNRELGLSYTSGWIDEKQHFKLNGKIEYKNLKRTPYNSILNKPVDIYTGEPLFKGFALELGTLYKPKFDSEHELKLGYHSNWIQDTMLAINPKLLGDGKNRQSYLSLGYTYTKDVQDYAAYPMSGYFAQIGLLKSGIFSTEPINQLTIEPLAQWSKSIWGPFSFHAFAKGRFELLQDEVPFLQGEALGYDDYIRGYELYVQEGEHFALFKQELRTLGLSSYLNYNFSWVPQAFRKIPIQVYFKLNNDFGKVWSKDDRKPALELTNQWNWGRGVGVDVVLFYEWVFQVEYSFNDLGENGLFLHFKTSL